MNYTENNIGNLPNYNGFNGLTNSLVNESNNNPGGMYGWICPKCGAVMSPFTSFCPNCTKRNFEITCTTASAESNTDNNLNYNFESGM